MKHHRIPHFLNPSLIRRLEPITLRGYLFSTILTVVIVYSLRSEDIVLSSLSLTVIPFLIAIFALAMLHAIRLRKRLRIECLGLDGLRSQLYSGDKGTLRVKISGPVPLPFFSAYVVPLFPESPTMQGAAELTCASSGENAVDLPLQFPHRGLWKLLGARITIRDTFGLTAYSWSSLLPNPQDIKVVPPPYEKRQLPIPLSESDLGTELPDLNHRQGEPLDLKRYHPADGTNRIVWKIFARTGELLSRLPEATVTPEGRLALLAIADKEEDHVCSGVVHYLAQLQEVPVAFKLWALPFVERRLVDSVDAARTLLLDNLWGNEPTLNGVQLFLELLREEWELPHRVVLAVSRERAASEDGKRFLEESARLLTQAGTSPSFFLFGRERTNLRSGTSTELSRFAAIAEAWFLETEKAPRVSPTDESALVPFFRSCREQHWMVEDIR